MGVEQRSKRRLRRTIAAAMIPPAAVSAAVVATVAATEAPAEAHNASCFGWSSTINQTTPYTYSSPLANSAPNGECSYKVFLSNTNVSAYFAFYYYAGGWYQGSGSPVYFSPGDPEHLLVYNLNSNSYITMVGGLGWNFYAYK